MRFSIIKGFWSDAGTFDSLLKVSKLIKNLENKNKQECNG